MAFFGEVTRLRLAGELPPPAGFPYQPSVKRVDAGIRAEDPYGDICSIVPERTPGVFNFGDACRTHDYGYDLIRFLKAHPSQLELTDSAALSIKAATDRGFFGDMMADCEGRLGVLQGACALSATAYASWMMAQQAPEDLYIQSR